MSLKKTMIFILPMLLVAGHCLEEIQKQGSVITETEAIVQKTINDLFSTLKLKRIQERPKILEYTTLHKYFMSISLQDDYNLKKILELTKVNKGHKYYNGTDFIAVINEIINEDKINGIYVDDISVISHIENFISRLKTLREKYAPKTIYVNINFKVLQHLHTTANQSFVVKGNDGLLSSDNEYWAWNNRLFRENPAFLSVRVGSSFYSGGGEVIPVLEIYFHPGYDPKSLRNNICILRLLRRLNFKRRNKKVKRIDIDRNPWNLPMTTPGVTILGWGAKGRSGIVFNPWKNILSYSVLDVYPLADCRDVYSRQYVTRKHFCAGFLSKGGGACNRDVGAPGVVDGKLIGVVSFGSPTCGTPDAPTVFTKLGYYTDWIEDIMEKPVPVSLKRTTKKPLVDIFNIIPMEGPTTTTFKIPPLTGKKLDPISIHDIDKSLRHIDENLFKEFISTMFTSSEIDKYQQIIRQQQKKEKGIVENRTGTVNVNSDSSNNENDIVFVTKMTDFDETTTTQGTEVDSEIDNDDNQTSKDESQETHKQKQSLLSRSEEDDETKDDAKLQRDIIQFMKNIDLKKIIQEEVMDTKEENKGKNETFNNSGNSDKTGQGDYNMNDNDGLSLEDTKFDDMTRSKPKRTNRILRDSEVYGLLSDVIEEEVQNKLAKGF